MKFPNLLNRTMALLTAILSLFPVLNSSAQAPISLHPANRHYFLFRGAPVVLMGSSEHYGALINLDFDYVPYLDESKSKGLNLIRIFTGTYRENAGAFGITDNTLAPPTSRTIVPWNRTATSGAADGGNKFDLNQWNPAYFSRLRDLVVKAGERGIVVEVTFFSAIYDNTLWNLSPLNASNHINGVGGNGRIESFSPSGNLVPFQKALARKFATELNGYDNVIYEICNEPYNGSVGQAWENLIVDELVATQAALPNRQLIARNVFNYQGIITNPHPSVSIFNFHYAFPAAASQNYGLNLALGDDETGFAGQADFPYRSEAWEFMLSGGGLFNHLDFSYTATRENGTAPQAAPGGGGPAIRRQLGALRGLLEGLPLVRLVPQPNLVTGGVPSGGAARALGLPGEAYAIYLRGGSQANLVLNLPAGTYTGQWIDTKTGAVSSSGVQFTHTGGQRTLNSPGYSEDIALRLEGSPPTPVGPQLLVNGSFESGYTGWTQTGNQVIQATSTDGARGVTFNGAQLAPNGVLSQTFTTTPGVTYTLTFDTGVLSYNQRTQSLQTTMTGISPLLSQVVTVTGSGNGSVRWESRTFTFVANSSTTTLTFRDQSTTTDSIDLHLDHVRVIGPVSGAANTAPVAVADSYIAIKDTTLVVPAAGVLANDTDPQSNPLSAVRVSGPANGTVTLNGNGSFSYFPNIGYTGNDSFIYQANDGSLNSNVATVSLTVRAPVVLPPPPGPLPLPKLMPLGDSITRGTNDINFPNGSIPGGYRKELASRLATDALAFDFVGASSDNAFPGMDPDHNGVNSFRTDHLVTNLSAWLAVDPDIVLLHAGTNDILEDIPVTTATANLESLINSITSSDAGRRLYIATIIPITQDWQGRTAAYLNGNVNTYNVRVRNLVTQYANLGRKVFLVEMNGSIVFTDPNPANNFYQPGDGIHPGQAGYNQMAAIWFNKLSDVENFPLPVLGPQILVNGSFESNFTGWTATGNQAIQASAAYAATDGTRLVAFNTGNSSPNGVLSQSFATTPGSTYLLTFDAGVFTYTTSPQQLQITVAGGSTLLSQVATLTGPGNGTARWVRHSFSFTANSGTSTLTFRDQSDTTSTMDLVLDNVLVTIGGIPSTNTAPVATADNYSTPINTPLVVPANGVLVNDTDAQGHPLTASISSGPSRGSVTLNADGGFSYTPAANVTGTDTFTYRANDGGLFSNVVTVNILTNPAATGPLVNGSFESGFTGWTTSGNQALQSTAPYAATDGSKLVGFNVENQTPNAVLSQSVGTIAGLTYHLEFDLGVLSYNTLSQTMQVTVTGNGSLLSRTITVVGSGSGNHWTPQSFTFVANSSSTTLTFRDQSTSTNGLDLTLDNVSLGEAGTPTNSAPVALADSYSTLRDIPLVVAGPGVLTNDTDAQSVPLTAMINSSPSNGSLTLASSGGFTYRPATGFTGTDSFSYHANDGRLDSNIVTVTLIVTAHVATTLVNGSFESGYTGWTFSGNQGIQSAAIFAATDGTKLVSFNGGNQTPNGILSQSFATTAGRTYNLNFDAGVLAYSTGSQTLQITVNGRANLLTRTLTLPATASGTGRWQAQTFTFVADGASAKLTFRDQSATSSNLDLLLDNVRITAPPLLLTAAPAPLNSLETKPQSFIQLPTPASGTPSLTGTAGNTTIRMTAASTGTYSLECSEDLVKWKWLREKVVAAGELVEFQDSTVPTNATLFYRIGYVPATTEE